MVKLTLEFDTINEMREFLDKRVEDARAPGNDDAERAAVQAGAVIGTPFPVSNPKPRGRPRKESAPVVPSSAASSSPAPVETQQEAATQPAAPADPEPTKVDAPTTLAPAAAAPTTDDAKAALERVFEKRGYQGAQQLISMFGASKLRDLPVEQYAGFIAAADKMVGA